MTADVHDGHIDAAQRRMGGRRVRTQKNDDDDNDNIQKEVPTGHDMMDDEQQRTKEEQRDDDRLKTTKPNGPKTAAPEGAEEKAKAGCIFVAEGEKRRCDAVAGTVKSYK